MSRHESSTTVFFSDRPSRGLRISLGLITAATGGIILGWPDVAVVTVAILVGIQLIVAQLLYLLTRVVIHCGLWRCRVRHLVLLCPPTGLSP